MRPSTLQPAVTDWVALWRDLVERAAASRNPAGEDPWAGRAADFHHRVRRRWNRRDSSRDFVLSRMSPDATLLDIGAGPGAWAMLLAQHIAQVTAVDCSPTMLDYLRENLLAAAVANVTVVEGAWPDVDVPVHDFSLCAHAVYGVPDLPGFVERMMAVTRRTCFLVLRAPLAGGITAEAARHLWGYPLDSPNFVVAYNVLLQLGLLPNVLVEDRLWAARISTDLDEALGWTKRHFGLTGTSEHDQYLGGLLERRLERVDEGYRWPPDMRSALVYWDV